MHPFYEDFKDLSQKELNEKLLNACHTNHLDVIDYLLTSSELKFNADINTENSYALKAICERGSLYSVKHFLTKFKDKIYFNHNISEGFLYACSENKNLDLVKYLLTNPDFSKHIDINVDNSQAFVVACNKGNLELVKYLTSSHELKKHVDIDTKDSLGFRLAMQNGSLDILQYLIFDLNIEKSKPINDFNDFLAKNEDSIVHKVNKMFETRELNKELNTELVLKEDNNKKLKI